MMGRWVADCGHEDFHGELHPIEAFVTSHAEPARLLRTDPSSGPESIHNVLTVSSAIVTADWPGGTIEFDVWPTARPSAKARLSWSRDQDTTIFQGLTVVETLQPTDNPNHLHVVVTAPYSPLSTGGWNDVLNPNLTRRLVAKYRLWWK